MLHRALLTAALAMATACGNPVENCDAYPEHDCCTKSGQCWDFYRIPEASYCYTQGRHSGGDGICSECATDDHCFHGKRCLLDAAGGFCGDCSQDGDCPGTQRCHVGTYGECG